MHLIIDGASKGFRDVDGCTQLFVKEALIQCTYQQIIKPRLEGFANWLSQNKEKNIEDQYNPIYISTIIRFLFYFRIFFPREDLTSILQFLTSIRTGNKSLTKVIYLCMNGYIILRHGDYMYFKNLEFFFKGHALNPVAADVFKVIYDGCLKEQGIS